MPPELRVYRAAGAFHGPDDEPAWVVRVDPSDGATGIFRDSAVVMRLSHPADAASLSPHTFRVEDQGGPVPSCLRLSPDGRMLIWRPQRLLVPGVEHAVVACGLRDCRGREVPAHTSRFVPCGLAREDLAE